MKTLPVRLAATVSIAAALVLGFGPRANADEVTSCLSGYVLEWPGTPGAQCNFDNPIVTLAPQAVAPACHKYRWWVVRHHRKHYYWACHEYPLP